MYVLRNKERDKIVSAKLQKVYFVQGLHARALAAESYCFEGNFGILGDVIGFVGRMQWAICYLGTLLTSDGACYLGWSEALGHRSYPPASPPTPSGGERGGKD